MAASDFWKVPGHFTVWQASALWCDLEPPRDALAEQKMPPEYYAIKQTLVGAISTGSLIAELNHPATLFVDVNHIYDYSLSTITRANLEAFARAINSLPAFLFDTLTERMPASIPKNRGGRPPTHDWDGAISEIVRVADMDGLPSVQAALVRKLQDWFSQASRGEPAESEIKARVSGIYRRLKEAGWKPSTEG